MLDTLEAPETLTTTDAGALIDQVRELVAAVDAIEAEKTKAVVHDAVAALLRAIANRL